MEVAVPNNPDSFCGRKAADVVWLEDEDVHCCKLFLCCMLRRWLESLYLISLGCVTTHLYQQHHQGLPIQRQQQDHQGLGCVTTHQYQPEHKGLGCVTTHRHQKNAKAWAVSQHTNTRRTQRLGLCHNIPTPEEHKGLGCHNTLTPARTQRPGLCHNKQSSKCRYPQHSYMWTICRHDSPLAYQHPPSTEGDKSSEDGVWLPMWRGKEEVTHAVLSAYGLHECVIVHLCIRGVRQCVQLGNATTTTI